MIPTADADYVCAMEAVLDVYERAYDPNNPVVGLDESPKQLISQVRETFTDSKGVIYQDYEYKREGVADIYVAKRKHWRGGGKSLLKTTIIA